MFFFFNEFRLISYYTIREMSLLPNKFILLNKISIKKNDKNVKKLIIVIK
jgi:hypothetical protein